MDETLIVAKISGIRQKIARRCRANDIDPSSVTLLGVTKYVPAELARIAVEAGVTCLGENKVQEAAYKILNVRPRPRWHLIGHLQKNKVKKAVELFDVIESVDSLQLAELISRRATEAGKAQEIFLEVNSSGESSKYGFAQGEIAGFADRINRLEGLKLKGLMTLGPLTDDERLTRKSFELTRKLYEKLKMNLGGQIKTLSMGMSGDYEIALDYGANELRIGTAIFGYRPGAK